MLRSNSESSPSPASPGTITAHRIAREITLDASPALLTAQPQPNAEWMRATPAIFSADWQGRNSDPERQTEVRLLWTPATLYLRFACRYRELFFFDDSGPNGRRDHLWDRDVAEAFLQPQPSHPSSHEDNYNESGGYKEFEVSPNGLWIDLQIAPPSPSNKSLPEGPRDLKSGLTRSVHLDPAARIWVAELAIPMRSLTANFDPSAIWRANFYRVEGKQEPRFYSAWQPTNTPQPNFHVHAAFGKLRFSP